MKTKLFLFLLLASLDILSAQISKQAKLPNKSIDNSRDIIRMLTDPAATSIEFKTIKTATDNLLRITGTVRNKGGKKYTSGVNQQQIQLWENYSSTSRKMVKQIPFVQLLPGEEIKIIYERKAFKASDEFPPDYELIIVYDPDIAIDANPDNDDAVASNNKLVRNPRS